MSRIGRKPISIPDSVTVTVNGDHVVVKGSKGELNFDMHKGISAKVNDGKLTVERANDERQTKAFHGLDRSLLQNLIEGVSQGFKKTLELVGTGYRVQKKGQGVSLAVGYSHTVEYEPSKDVQVDVEGNNIIHVSGIDKHEVGQVAAEIRGVRPPEPYLGKGIRYQGEYVKTKPGKKAKTE